MNNKIEKLKNKIKSVKVDSELVTVKRQMKKIQSENRLDLNTKLWGWMFGLIGFLGFLASTCMSITAGVKTLKDLSLLAFIIGVVFIQLVVYVICIKDSIIKYRFPRYYPVAKMVQLGLLAISINYNFEFYEQKTFWNLLLSVLLEITIIVITSLGGDFRSLSYQEKRRPNLVKSGGLFSVLCMMYYNKLHKLKSKVLSEYNQNLTQSNELRRNLTILPSDLTNENLQIEDSQGLGLVKTRVKSGLSSGLSQINQELSQVKSELSPIILLKEKNLDELRFEIETYLNQNFKDGEIVTTGKIREIFNLTESQWKKIKNDLNCLETVGTKLKYKNEKEEAKNEINEIRI